MNWAQIVKQNISESIAKEIKKEELQQESAAKQKEFERLEDIMWNLFINTVIKNYGLKKPFDLHCDRKIILPRGEFWYFYVDVELRKKRDGIHFQWNYQIRNHIKNSAEFNDYVKGLSEDQTNRKQFRLYMYEVHGKNWLGDIYSNYTYDCTYIDELRALNYNRECEYEAEVYELEHSKNQADEKHEADMKRKLEIGEITKDEYEQEFNPCWEEKEMEKKLSNGHITYKEYSTWKRDKMDEDIYAEYRWEGMCMDIRFAEERCLELDRKKEEQRKIRYEYRNRDSVC